MRFASTMILAASLVLAPACKGGPPEAPGGAPDRGRAEPGARVDPGELPAEVLAMRLDLAAAGVKVADVQRLEGHTMPGGCREQWRYRVFFSDREFLNVNRFPDADAATACLETYRASLAKGGQAALDRLMPLVAVDGPFLFQFSPTTVDANLRATVLAAVHEGAAAPPGD